MIYTMLKSCFQNKDPKVLTYRDFRNYSPEDLKQDLAAALNDCGDSCDVFEQRFANKTKSHLNIRNYKKQQKIVVNLNKEAKLQYFNNYDSTTQNLFGKIVNHIFLANIVRPILILY